MSDRGSGRSKDATSCGSATGARRSALALDLAEALKRAQRERQEHRLLPGRTVGLVFEKPSTRMRVSFGVGIHQLGGTALYLSSAELQLGRGETIRDTASVLSRYLDAIVIRSVAQADVEEFAEHGSIPVINGLTEATHPCQALADVMTIRERLGRLEGVRVAYVGDGNNVCASLMVACASFGASFVAGRRPGTSLAPGRSRRPAREAATWR